MATMISKGIVAITWTEVIAAIMWSNNYLNYHCCNNVLHQWPLFTLLQQCAPTRWSKMQQTNMNEAIRCSLLTLKWEPKNEMPEGYFD
jgi:hypothetical protein